MTPAALVLESFEGTGCDAPGSELSGVELQEMQDLPDMDAAPIRPPQAPEDDLLGDDDTLLDPEAVLREELVAERTALQAVTAAITAQTDELHAAVTRQAADAVAQVAREVLPALVDEGFASELAAAVVGIVEAGGSGGFRLELADDDHDTVVEGLKAHLPSLPVTVTSEPGRASGSARLNWQGGGAEFDIAAMVARVRHLLADRISAILERKTDNV
jgi:hypothetical protein